MYAGVERLCGSQLTLRLVSRGAMTPLVDKWGAVAPPAPPIPQPMYNTATQACTNFLAGDMLRSKSCYSALDETAVMGAACRYESSIPCVKHGKRYVQSVCMIA